nr:hypothetical protein [Streptomyces sp. SID5468]
MVGRDDDPTPGDLDVLKDWENYFRRRADDADFCLSALRKVQGNVHTLDLDGSWLTALWGRIDYLADALLPEKAVHEGTADAFRTFRGALQDIQHQADQALDQAREAHRDKTAATVRLQGLAGQSAAKPSDSTEAALRNSTQNAIDDADGRLRRAKGQVDDAAWRYGVAAQQVVTALRQSEESLGRTIFAPPSPDRNTSSPGQPSFLHRFADQALTDIYVLAGITAGTLRGAAGIGEQIDLMMLGAPELRGPGAAFALADGSAPTGLADAYAFGANPYKGIDFGGGRLDDSWLFKTYDTDPAVVGSAKGKTLRSPNSRHTIMGAKSGPAKEKNTIILPGLGSAVDEDIAEIAAGRAKWNEDAQRYEINGRTYAVEPSGTIMPGSGSGFVLLDRVEYSALKEIVKAGGDLDKCQQFKHKPDFVENPEKIQRVYELYRTYYP